MAHVDRSRSPSPLPPAPSASTPGPLFTTLTNLYRNAIAHTIRTCSYTNFAFCFPTPAAQRPELLKSLWTQVVTQIEQRCMAEFEDICGERNVGEGLGGWESVVEGAKRRRIRGEVAGEGPGVAPHTLPPEELYMAHLSPMLGLVERELEGMVRDTEQRNEELEGLIRGQREEVEGLVAGLEAVMGDVEGVRDVFGEMVGIVRAESEKVELGKA